ncbi:uncharacterized protein HMPREF1541_01857 [Cyphellophora europaea CBS 101466]|uniref:Thioesterase domain-containing protein n=1 Tax=Cyphellophora europaea (strain CBS 101466) TaxID=1220924 RepID=W2S408_CYPE1|nr:uncharacterized protein HMPREF1541_01857 [Cyphellophora europaea CBS 101466]ETN42699.1 hypothetical protein HMPREF1541_01857 [Cyphellophora europaea CBS 101466]
MPLPPNLHPDFSSLPWIHQLLTSTDPTLNLSDTHTKTDTYSPPTSASNTLFATTLANPSSDAIRASLHFTRRCPEPDSIAVSTTPARDALTPIPTEHCTLLSLGTGIDGKTSRAHGGFNALLLDHQLGRTAAVSSASATPATATMTVDYKAPVVTPGVVLVRAWLVGLEGRKIWVRGVVEDGEGRALAVGKALFLKEKGGGRI